ncbi:Endonuclease/exonuclease/phosphatase [Fusarium sp. MPI-SDFR-AT-0072]|nr:Endonuclease/exonuclease/phosphatase [Fusarium sp. MPI-SDFR-AT-0072]
MHLYRIAVTLTSLMSTVSALTVKSTKQWTIGTDVQGSERLNGVSYQEDALITYGDYQYVTFYETAPAGYLNHFVKVGRRRVSPSVGDWEFLTLDDYTQKTMDGHNMISMGISGDGKIHLSFDHHDVPINYRISKNGIAKDVPSKWTSDLFDPVVHELVGSQGPYSPLTYPRFEPLGNGDLLLEFRIGQSGSGDSYIHRYSASTGKWQAYGMYIQGDDNNAETPNADTNHGVYFAYSNDDGKTWFNTNDTKLAKPISTSDDSTLIWDIPQNSRMVNQEGQLIDTKGRFHILMRDLLSGEHQYQHYLRKADGTWTKNAINPAGLNGPDLYDPRGKLAGDASGEYLFGILPDPVKQSTGIYVATASKDFKDWKSLAEIPNTSTEPLFDKTRLHESGILSVFVRQAGGFPDRKLQALIQKQMENAIALSKPASSLPWRPDEPWKQPFYRWSSSADEWQPLQASKPSPNKFKATRLAVYSWNIDFMLPHGDSRMNSALKHLEELSRQHRNDNNTAVVINIQECVPSDLTLIGEKDWIRDGFYRTDVDTANWASGAYGTTTLVDRRLDVLSCFRVHYSATRMERDALFVDVEASGQKLRLCNTHLESLALEPPRRPAQMELIASHMHADDISGAVVTGDFNAIQPFDRTLHTDNKLEDAYLKLGGTEGDGRDDNEGYTWGQQALPELRQLFGCSRMDKVFFCGDGLELLEFERFGNDVEPDESEEDVRKDLLSLGFERPWITDHLGVKAVFEVKH